jgi:(S)-2-hydroxyglutarate dehydrogenase
MEKRCDFLVIGGGIVGLSVGRELLRTHPNARVIVLEKESTVGAHASGRNSGVLHAGFYYSPDSLKAKFCLEGNFALRGLIKEHGIPINECGKVVVASNEDDLARLDVLFERGIANGVKLLRDKSSNLHKFEPLATSYKEFLWSSHTAVSDPIAVTNLIAQLFIEAGGEIQYNAKANILDDGSVNTGFSRIRAERIVNSAGTNAIHIAHSLGVGKKYAQLPVLGLYKYCEQAELPLRTLIYPVPNPKNPFLGVHFTLTVDKKVKIGPTAIPILGREQYGLSGKLDGLDLASSVQSVWNLFLESPAGLANLAYTELPKISTRRLVRDGKRLVPTLDNSIIWHKKRAGIRAQLVDREKRTFEMDFKVEAQGKIIHILNAVSPGWTSAIPFAKHVVNKYI